MSLMCSGPLLSSTAMYRVLSSSVTSSSVASASICSIIQVLLGMSSYFFVGGHLTSGCVVPYRGHRYAVSTLFFMLHYHLTDGAVRVKA